MVCPAITSSKAGKDAVKPFVDAIGAMFPLVKVPALAPVRQSLISKFPYAEHAATRILTDLTTKRFVHFSPILLVGPPGSGKSTFVRTLADQLKVGLMRVDGANDFSSGFSGTERRWSTSEPCRPFMAVARFRQANPIVLVDEIDKATSRQDYGRLWELDATIHGARNIIAVSGPLPTNRTRSAPCVYHRDGKRAEQTARAPSRSISRHRIPRTGAAAPKGVDP